MTVTGERRNRRRGPCRKARLRILLADDHALLREGVKQILAEGFPHAEFGETGTTQETMARLRAQPWDVLVLDVFMPGGGGLEVLRAARANWPQLAVLVLSSAPEEQLALRVVQSGARGYLNKQAAPTELVRAMKKILSGTRYLSPRLEEKLVSGPARHAQAPHQRLSDREFQVLQLIAGGKILKQIAAELRLSPKTVSTFRRRMLEKLGLQNDIELVHYALEHRLVERPATTKSPPGA
jgi:two-component system, NarL family, invasion response regulator UvrY